MTQRGILRSKFRDLLVLLSILLLASSSAHGQRSLSDIGRSGGSKKKACRKVAVMVNGLRRMQCKKSKPQSRLRKITDTMRRQECTTSRSGKRRCKWITYFRGHTVDSANLSKERLKHPSGDIWFYALHFHQEVRLNIYDQGDRLNDTSLAQMDEGFRCRRSRQARAVDPRLFVFLSRIQDHWPGKRIDLVSGFRFQTNEGSRHYHAAAMDIRVPGVDAQELYDYAETLDRGGMGIGIYPFAKFVHIDFRAPGEKSYRWVDISPKNYAERGRNISDRASSQ